MQVAINGAKAAPKVWTRSSVAIIERLWVRNPYALMNVNIRRATPTPKTAIPVRVIFSLKVLNMFFPFFCILGFNIKGSAPKNRI
jgi:hypothetical protein